MTPSPVRQPRAGIAVIGMGRTGCSVVRFLVHRGLACEAFDEHLKKLPAELPVRLHTGRLRFKALEGFSRIIVSPGVPWNHPVLVALRKSGVEMGGDLDLFSAHFSGELVAVTGTNGKSTVAHLLGVMLEVLPGGVEVGGNIGTPMLDILMDVEQPRRVVLELSSFQLERTRSVHPRWAVLLNLQPDHADMHESTDAYAAAKERLFAVQGEGDTAMLPQDERWDALAGDLEQRRVRVRRFGIVEDESRVDAGLLLKGSVRRLFWRHGEGRRGIDLERLAVCGQHQHLNLAVAAQGAADFGVSAAVIEETLTAFRGLTHRLQCLGRFAGKLWYDDSKATNPAAAAAALAAFARVIWICGGVTKDLALAPLRDAVRAHVALALIIGKDPKPFVSLLKQAGVPFRIAGDVRHAVVLAAQIGTSLPVLLSPAAASQDQFRDYAERGRSFCEAIAALEKAA